MPDEEDIVDDGQTQDEEGQGEGDAGSGSVKLPPIKKAAASNQQGGKGQQKTDQEEDDKDDDEKEEDVVLSFDEWLAKQSKKAQETITAHVTGLKVALDDRKGELKELRKELKTLRDAAAEGSALKTQLTGLTEKMDTAEQRLEFYEQAHGHRIRNLKLAWVAVKNEDGGLESFQDRKGQIDWEMLEEKFPELFIRQAASRPPDVRQGSGSQGGTKTRPVNMNQAMRGKLGRD